MSLSIGIVGLPNVGKSTLFKALTKQEIEIANYPFATIDPNVGIVQVPDTRLDQLSKMSASTKVIPATIEFVDIAGLVKGASRGEGLGNSFLANIREVDAIGHVVRCFEDTNITHVHERINPQDDIDIIETELIFADLETVLKMLQKTEREARSGNKEAVNRNNALQKMKAKLEAGEMTRDIEYTDDEQEAIKDIQLLTQKAILYIGNVSEEDIALPKEELKAKWPLKGETIYISMKLEEECSELGEEESEKLLGEYNITQSSLEHLIKASYSLLNLMTYITTGEQETRGWTIKRATKAPQAAGVIHSDFERGFIAADTIQWDVLLKAGSRKEARDQGLVRIEGKEYIVKDGDVMEFKYSV